MSEQNVNTPAATEPAFDFAAWKAQQDSTEAATRTGTAPAPTPKAAEAAAPGKPGEAPAAKADAQPPASHDEDEEAKLTRAQRRRVRQAETERDQALGRLQAYEELVKSGLTPRQAQAATEPAAPPKAPERADFETEASFSAAVAKWEAKEAVAAAEQRRTAEQGEQAERAEFDRKAAEANRIYTEQLTDYPDHAEAIESLKAVPFDASKQGTLLILISQSLERAGIADYWHKHPDSLKYIMGLEPEAQHSAFARLEGKVEAMREARKGSAPPAAGKKEEPKPPAPPARAAANNRDAEKAAPSESATPKAGEAANGIPSMTLSDGTMNPAWKAYQNDREGRRR